jgi:hypothetical protein
VPERTDLLSGWSKSMYRNAGKGKSRLVKLDNAHESYARRKS